MINLSATLLSTELITYQPRRLATNFFRRPTAGSVYNLFAFWTVMPGEGVGLLTIDHGCIAARRFPKHETGVLLLSICRSSANAPHARVPGARFYEYRRPGYPKQIGLIERP